MAYLEAVLPAPASEDWVVEALRCYCAARWEGEPILPAMLCFAETRQVGTHGVIALTSVFELAEACLGRALVAEAEGAPHWTDDEQAILMLLASVGDVGTHCGSSTVPHGLPGTLAWAVRTANRLCGRRCTDIHRELASCPFDG